MRQERAERTRIALITAAATVFDQLGYEGATLTGVSERAMMSKGALFFHFANKAELADTVQILACSCSRSRLDALFGRGIPALQTVIDMTHAAALQLTEDPVVRAGMRLTLERDTRVTRRCICGCAGTRRSRTRCCGPRPTAACVRGC
ncbi:TetR family transcriptional regulator [Streptomyces sp. M19]